MTEIREIASPLRLLGALRIVAGMWLIAAGVMTLRQLNDLLPIAQRLFSGDTGTTDAPIRSLLQLATAPLLIVIGVVIAVQGARWLRRIAIPADGPAAIAHDEVIATLTRREAPAFGPGPSLPYWPLRRWFSDALDELPWWRRELMGRGVRALVRACGFSLALGALVFAVQSRTTDDVLGPFPTAFVVVLLFVTALWAILSLMLIPSHGPRIEALTFPLHNRGHAAGTVIESTRRLLEAESPVLGLTLGAAGIGVQCVITVWWQLSPIGYPHMATSIVRHAGSLAGGVVFFVLGSRMVAAAAEMLLRFRYESTVVYIGERVGQNQICHAAAVRSESREPAGPRHIVVAVDGTDALESAEELVRVRATASPHPGTSRAHPLS